MRTTRAAVSALLVIVLVIAACQTKKPEQNPYLRADKTSLHETANTGEDSLTVDASISWSVGELPAWMHASPASGSAGTTKVRLRFGTNARIDPLSTLIKLIPAVSGSVDTVRVPFLQEGAAPVLRTDQTLLTEKPEGQLDSFYVSANGNWTISLMSGSGWLSVNPLTGGAGTTKVYVTAAANRTPQAQSGSILVQSTVTSNVQTTVTLTQGIGYAISGFSPATVAQGSNTPVTVTGIFDGSARPVVQVNGSEATVTSFNSTTISFSIPLTATSGRITVSFGGKTLRSATDLIVSYNGHWVKVAAGCAAGYYHSLSFVSGDKFYIGLGNDANNRPNRDFKIFDPATNTCTQGPILPAAVAGRSYASCFVLKEGSKDLVYLGWGT